MKSTPTGGGGETQVSARTVWFVGLNILAMAAVVLFIYSTRQIFLLLLISLILTGGINPVIDWMEGKGLKRPLAVILLFAVLFALLVLLILSFIPLFQDQIANFVDSAPGLLGRIREHPLFRWVDERYNVTDFIRHDLERYGKDMGLFFFGVLKGFFQGIFAILTVAVLTIFMLIFGGEIIIRALDLLTPGRRFRYLQLARAMQKTVAGYVIGTVFIAAIGGGVMTATLLILGIPYFLLLGFLTFLLGLIPYLGPILAGVAIVGTALTTAGIKAAIVTGIVFVVYQQVENHVLQPLIQRRTIQMNPFLIVVAMLLGISLAGIMGAVFALPVAGAIQVLFRGLVLENAGSPPARGKS